MTNREKRENRWGILFSLPCILMILQMLFKRKSWHQERGKKSVGIVSGTPSVKVRRADGRNAKKNRVTE